MGDAQIALHFGLLGHADERGYTTGAAQTVQAAVNHGDTRRIVTTIFEFAQPFQQNGNYIAPGDCTDDSTHDSYEFD
jgi:hypothetical protein